MCSDLEEGSRCCAFYSATGFVFTVRLSDKRRLSAVEDVGDCERPLPVIDGNLEAKPSDLHYCGCVRAVGG